MIYFEIFLSIKILLLFLKLYKAFFLHYFTQIWENI